MKKCPFCNGEAQLFEYHQSVDGRGNKLPFIRCKCGAEMKLLNEEFNKLENKHNFRGGYLSEHKELWDDMHNKVVEKWNSRG